MRCNRACNYCFAKEKLHSYAQSKVETEISLQNLEKVIEFLSKSNCDTIQLAGGEPTIHPKFKENPVNIGEQENHCKSFN